MRTSYLTIMVLAAFAVMWPGVTDVMAEETDQTSTSSVESAEIGPGRRHRAVMTEERIERMLNRLKQTDPEKAEELENLREEDTEKFQEQLREYFRSEFERRMRRQAPEQPDTNRGPRTHRQMRSPNGGGKGPIRERMWKKHTDFMSWLTENYPDQAERLKKLQQEDTEAYFRQLASSMKMYKPIMKALKRNPEFAEVLKEDLLLKERRSELLADIKAATDEGEKEQLTNQLEEIVAERFELIIKRKQVQYEELLKKLELLSEQVKQRKNEVDSLKSQKADKVKERLEELLGGTEKVHWD